MKFVAVGEMVIDFLPGDEEGIYVRKAGGAPANVAIAVSRNGISAGFCGIVGDDDFGHFLVDTLKQNNVIYLADRYEKNATTTMAFVSLDKSGDRSFTFARKPGADMFLTKEDVDKINLNDIVIVQAGSCSLSKGIAKEATEYAIKKAHEKNKIVSFDVNYRNLIWNDDRNACRNSVINILPFVDILKISDEETDMIGVSIEEAIKKYDIKILIVTKGKDGAICFFNNKKIEVEGLKVNCIDTTGAGDAFLGGFISYLLKNAVNDIGDLDEEKVTNALYYGNIAGSICVEKRGAIESFPTFDEIEKIMF